MGRLLYDWPAIQAYHDEGHGFVECQRRFGMTHTAWNKAIKRGDLKTAARPFRDRRRRYNWAEVQRYYDEGHTYRECREKFGFTAETFQIAVRRGDLKASGHAYPLSLLLAKSDRTAIRNRLLQIGLLRNVCDDCGISEWLGEKLSMHLDHINGINDDNRLENLRMLCPNCHSQTPTFGGRNVQSRKFCLQEDPSIA